jgi:hypothetical protein
MQRCLLNTENEDISAPDVARFQIQIINSVRRPSFDASGIELSFSLLAPLNQALILEIAILNPCLP